MIEDEKVAEAHRLVDELNVGRAFQNQTLEAFIRIGNRVSRLTDLAIAETNMEQQNKISKEIGEIIQKLEAIVKPVYTGMNSR
jgi:hypothetical protein